MTISGGRGGAGRAGGGGGAGVDTGRGLGRAGSMRFDAPEFERLVGAILQRFWVQNARPNLPAAELAAWAARLAAVVAERGLPAPGVGGEQESPGGLPEADLAALTGRVAGEAADPWLTEATRQFVKACFYPELRTCRDTFREVARDGTCRRQQLERARTRISGAHCVDCPHWTSLAPADHVAFLTREWRGDPAVWASDPGVFLPEDFGALRRWLQAVARP